MIEGKGTDSSKKKKKKNLQQNSKQASCIFQSSLFFFQWKKGPVFVQEVPDAVKAINKIGKFSQRINQNWVKYIS